VVFSELPEKGEKIESLKVFVNFERKLYDISTIDNHTAAD
jgi:hypothetical protein